MFQRKKPDLHKPRFSSVTYRHNIINKDLYESLRLQYKLNITFEEFKEIGEKIMTELTKQVLIERDGVKLPNMLGIIYLGYLPFYQKSKMPDYPIENFHSRGKVAKIIYEKNEKFNFDWSGFFSFAPHRQFQRDAHEMLLEHPENYKNAREKKLKNGNKGTVDISG